MNNNHTDEDCVLGRCGDWRLTDAELNRNAEIQPRIVMLRFWLNTEFDPSAPSWADQPVAAPAVSYVLPIFLLPIALYLLRLGA